MVAGGPTITVTAAEPVIPPSVTLNQPVPMVVAVNVGPTLVPIPPMTFQVGAVRPTELPYWSNPSAVKGCESPTNSVIGVGFTMMVASGPTVAVSVNV